MPREGLDGTNENADNPTTPASEPVRSQPASPQKKKRKVSRSQSIPAQSTAVSSTGYPPPNVYAAPPGESMMAPHMFDDHMHGPPMSNPAGMHMGSPMGHPMSGPPSSHPHMMHPSAPLPHHMQPGMPPHMTSVVPPHHGHGGSAGHLSHPLHHPASARFMRPGLAQGVMHPHHHMSIANQPIHPQGMGPQMGHGPMPSYSSPVSMANRVYPAEPSMVYNSSNPHVPPMHPCGACRKEIGDTEAIFCESGCNFWYHRQCTGLTDNAFQLLTKEYRAEWVCDPCFHKKNIPLIKIKA